MRLLRNNAASIVLRSLLPGCATGWLRSCPVRQRGSLMLSCCVTGQPHIARLGKGTASILPGCVTGRLHFARLGNGTASILPGCVTGLPRCVTGYRGFGVVYPDSRLHNGAPRYVTGIPIRNWTSWVSVRNICMVFGLVFDTNQTRTKWERSRR